MRTETTIGKLYDASGQTVSRLSALAEAALQLKENASVGANGACVTNLTNTILLRGETLRAQEEVIREQKAIAETVAALRGIQNEILDTEQASFRNLTEFSSMCELTIVGAG